MHRCDNGSIRTALKGRGCGDNARNTRNRGCQHGHMGRCYHREFSCRYIAANRLNRDILVPKNDPRHGFDFNILHRRTLNFSKFPDLILGKPDIVHVACRNLRHQFINLILCQAKAGWREIIEFFGQVTHRAITACLNIGKCRFNHRTHFCIIFSSLCLRLAIFQISNGHLTLRNYVASGRGAMRSPRSKASQPSPLKTSTPSCAMTCGKSTITQLSTILPSTTFQKSI